MSNANGFVDSQYVISPDKKWVAYLADAETDNLNELYVSKLDGSVIGKKISPAANDNARTIDNIVWSPDSTKVAYISDQEILHTLELYVSSVNGGIGVKVSADPQTGRENNTDLYNRMATSAIESERTSDLVQWAPDGSRIAYLADWDTNDIYELYTTTPDGNANVVKVSNATTSASLAFKNKRQSFAWSPDSSKIAYRLATDGSSKVQIYVADPTATSSTTQVNPDMPGLGETVYEFEWAPDSSKIAFTFFVPSQGDRALFVLPPKSHGANTVNWTPLSPQPTHASASEVMYFSWAPDSSRIAYVADLEGNASYELFTIQPGSTASNVRVSGDTSYQGLKADGSAAFSWSPDGQYIAYLSYQQYNNVQELFASTPDGSSNVKLSGPLSSSKNIWKFAWSPDSGHVAYIGDQNYDGVDELFVSPIAGASGSGPASNPRLNPDLVSGGNIDRTYLQWTADSQRVLYYADQEVDAQLEFYSSTRDGNTNNVKVSEPVPMSFANDIYPSLSACSGCHGSGAAHPWYAASASGTYNNMANESYFNNNFIVDKLDGTVSHSGGTYTSIATAFSQWISEGANNN